MPRQAQDQASILDALLKLPDNQYCVDCGTRGPRWASVNLGIFICITCSGIHRSIGVHVTLVKSVSLDKWKPEHIQRVQEVGNKRAKEYYEANVPPGTKRPRPNDTYGLEQWIRAKYERKQYVGTQKPVAPKSAANTTSTASGRATSTVHSTSHRRTRSRDQRRANRRAERGHNRSASAAAPKHSAPLVSFETPSANLAQNHAVSAPNVAGNFFTSMSQPNQQPVVQQQQVPQQQPPQQSPSQPTPQQTAQQQFLSQPTPSAPAAQNTHAQKKADIMSLFNQPMGGVQQVPSTNAQFANVQFTNMGGLTSLQMPVQAQQQPMGMMQPGYGNGFALQQPQQVFFQPMSQTPTQQAPSQQMQGFQF